MAVAAATATIVVLLVYWSVFSVWTATSWLSFPHFLGAVLVLFVLPGSLLSGLFRLDVTPIEHLTLATVLGMAATGAIYAVLQWSGAGWLLWAWIAIGTLGVRALWRTMSPGSAKTPGKEHVALPLVVLAACTPLAAINFYYTNLSLTGDGRLVFVVTNDLLLHASITSELTHTVPPQVPFLAGAALNYHVGMDVATAVLVRFGGLALPDLMVRFCPTLFIATNVLAAFCLIRRVTGSGPAAVVGALLAVLGEDLAFIPGWLQGSAGVWSVAYFRVPTAFSLAWHNPMVVAHGFMFMSFFCLQRAAATSQLRWAAPFALLCAVLIEIKLFTYIHLVGALALSSAVLLLARRGPFLIPGIAAACASLPLAGYMAVVNLGTPSFVWIFKSAIPYYVSTAWTAMALPWLAGHTVFGTAAYLAMTFGYRLFGIPAMLRSLVHFVAQPFEFFLTVFVVLGPVLTLGSYVVPVAAGPSAYNNSVWFLGQAKYAATVLAMVGLCAIWRNSARVVRIALVPLVAVAGFASTVQYVSKVATRRPVAELTRSELAMIAAENDKAAPGDVILTTRNPSVLTLTRLRVPFHGIFEASFASVADLPKRRAAVDRFWSSWANGSVESEPLVRHRVRWVAAEKKATPPSLRDGTACVVQQPCLTKVFETDDHLLFRVDPAP